MEDKPKKGSRSNDGKYTAFDRALIAAARNHTTVALEFAHSGDVRPCKIVSVDRYFIEIENVEENNRHSWVNKSCIAEVAIP